MLRFAALLCAMIAATAAGVPGEELTATGHAAEIHAWQQERLQRLLAEDGWLSLVGLHWLKPGVNSFGSGAGSGIRLAVPGIPEYAGILDLSGRGVILRANRGVRIAVDGRSVRQARLRPDDQKDPSVIELDRLRMTLIRRGERLGLRVKDPESSMRKEFAGLEYFPVDPYYRVRAQFVSYPQQKKFEVADATGGTQVMISPGYATFELNGQSMRLEPALEGDRLFFIFRDATSGKETYGAGRYLYTDLPKDGGLVIDFNQAYNPPCAFTPYATCPLPPRQNHLPVAVRAGELQYANPAHP
jgi:uncharacterized protein